MNGNGGDDPMDERRSPSSERLQRVEDTVQTLVVKNAVLETKVSTIVASQEEIKRETQTIKDGQAKALVTTVLTLIGVLASIALQLLAHTIKVP
jgi:hypothetical protein